MEHSHTHLFIYHWRLLLYSESWIVGVKITWTANPKIFAIWLLQKKMFTGCWYRINEKKLEIVGWHTVWVMKIWPLEHQNGLWKKWLIYWGVKLLCSMHLYFEIKVGLPMKLINSSLHYNTRFLPLLLLCYDTFKYWKVNTCNLN